MVIILALLRHCRLRRSYLFPGTRPVVRATLDAAKAL
jgi:hypothetical protein